MSESVFDDAEIEKQINEMILHEKTTEANELKSLGKELKEIKKMLTVMYREMQKRLQVLEARTR